MAKKLTKVMPLDEIEQYINQFTQSNANKYQKADWLLSDFNDHIWKLASISNLNINWSVRLGNGELLTLPKHDKLLRIFKSWLIVQTHYDLTNGQTYSPRSLSARLTRVLYCIDYFLLRSNTLNLSEHGFNAITNNQIKEFLAKIGQGYLVSESIYEFQFKFEIFIRTQLHKSPTNELDLIIEENSWLSSDLNERHLRDTNLSDREVILARAWLWKNDLYQQSSKYKYDLDISQLTKYLYADTLLGQRIIFYVPHELKIGFLNEYKSEYPGAKVVADHDSRMASKEFSRFVSSFLSLNLVLKLDKSNKLLDSDYIAAFQPTINLKTSGRFKTLPHSVYDKALCSAIEYVLNNGDFLIDAFLKFAHESIKSGLTTYNFINSTDICLLIDEKALKFGINRWRIPTRSAFHKKNYQNKIYYDSLRKNVGLYESLRVLYGAVQIIVGSLSAQRSGSLKELVAGQCLDSTKTRLTFFNKKSGHSGLNQKISRPIPPIVVISIEMIERLQSCLIQFGLLDKPTYLFAYPQINTLLPSNKLFFTKYVDSFDFFCDWAELPLNSDGQRYYIRNHQLRRHFAMLFFWGNGYGGMNPLRWFLGHTDVQHLWHYITEISPGHALRSVAAEWGTHAVINGAPEAHVLNSLLSNHFGTNDFSVIESDVLQAYLEELIENDRLSITPQFIDNGKDYKIGVILKSKKD